MKGNIKEQKLKFWKNSKSWDFPPESQGFKTFQSNLNFLYRVFFSVVICSLRNEGSTKLIFMKAINNPLNNKFPVWTGIPS